MTNTTPTLGSQTVALICATTIAVATLVTVVLLVVFAPREQNLATLIAALFAGGGAMVASIIGLAKGAETARTVDELANGKMDAKIRAGIGDMIDPRYLRDDVAAQLEADRARR